MIEKIIYDYLIDKGFNAYTETPSDPPTEYVRIERTGGRKQNGIPYAMIAVQSISAISLLNAVSLNRDVKAAMEEMPAETPVYSCRLNSDYNYTDIKEKRYRYQAVFDIYYEEE